MSELIKMRICDRHEKQVPLMWTFAFPGAECWCPYCGYTWGMFGDVREVEATPELIEEGEKWEEKSNEFLDAKGTMVCESLLWKGKRVKPSELPPEELARLQRIIDDWKYEGQK